MAHAATGSIVRQIESLFEGRSVSGLTDQYLLERFTVGRDAAGDAAFAALVTRYGPMVLRVCRQVLGYRHHAEDAFQAVFLVLACKARSIRDRDLLGPWLYGVAIRSARKAKVRLDRRRRIEESCAIRRPGLGSSVSVEPTVQPAAESALASDQAEALHDEIDRLPRDFRSAVVLCYFEGLTLDETARRLRCPAGTVRSRLARARDKLRRRLTRRGIVLPACGLAAVLSSSTARASISSRLCDITARAAIQFAAGSAADGAASASAMALAHEVLRTMLVQKLRFNIFTLLALAAFATGLGYLAHALAMNDGPNSSPARQQSPVAVKPEDANPKPAPGRMFVVGRVLDPNGKPVPGATVAVQARSLTPVHAPYLSRLSPVPIGDARADDSGRFRIDAPRTSSSNDEAFGAVALAPGYGAGWVELDPDDDQPTADISLRPERVIHGRLLDLQGRPVPEVTLSVSFIRGALPQPPARDQSRLDGAYWGTNADRLPARPEPVTTNLEGRFTLRGVGRDLHVLLAVHHPRFALQTIEVETDSASESKPLTAALIPAQVLTGRVTYADTGKPVPHAPLEVLASQGRVAVPSAFETDAQGRFRVNPPPADRWYGVTAFPPEGEPYLIAKKSLEWPKGAIEQSLDLALPRGVLIRGKVTEEGSGKPVAGATAYFLARALRQIPQSRGILIDTASDGSFQLGAFPSPGYLFIKGPSDDYVLREFGNRMVDQGEPGGRRIYSHAHSLLDLKPGIHSQEVNVVLRRGATVTGQVVGPDGQPVRDAWMLSRIILDPGLFASWTGRHHGKVRNGRFEIHGLDADTEVPVYFLEPKRKLGGVVNLSGKLAARGPVTVRLESCGAARARFVDPGGKLIAGRLPRGIIRMVVTPGPPYSSAKDKAGLISADDASLTGVDLVNYESEQATDADGRLTLPVLIPGATYRVVDDTMAVRGEIGPELRKEFTVKPGETLDLGDVLIEKPPR